MHNNIIEILIFFLQSSVYYVHLQVCQSTQDAIRVCVLSQASIVLHSQFMIKKRKAVGQ